MGSVCVCRWGRVVRVCVSVYACGLVVVVVAVIECAVGGVRIRAMAGTRVERLF